FLNDCHFRIRWSRIDDATHICVYSSTKTPHAQQHFRFQIVKPSENGAAFLCERVDKLGRYAVSRKCFLPCFGAGAAADKVKGSISWMTPFLPRLKPCFNLI